MDRRRRRNERRPYPPRKRRYSTPLPVKDETSASSLTSMTQEWLGVERGRSATELQQNGPRRRAQLVAGGDTNVLEHVELAQLGHDSVEAPIVFYHDGLTELVERPREANHARRRGAHGFAAVGGQ